MSFEKEIRTQIQKEGNCGKAQGATERGLRRDQPCGCLELGLPASRTVFKPPRKVELVNGNLSKFIQIFEKIPQILLLGPTEESWFLRILVSYHVMQRSWEGREIRPVSCKPLRAVAYPQSDLRWLKLPLWVSASSPEKEGVKQYHPPLQSFPAVAFCKINQMKSSILAFPPPVGLHRKEDTMG